MIISLKEIFDIIVMTLILGFIFSDTFSRYRNPSEFYIRKAFDWESIKFAMMITAPAIILHEFGHKFAAMAFGLQAVFNAAYLWLGVGLLMKLSNLGFIFFVPAYVSISGTTTPLVFSFTAFAGPLVNLILWIGTKYSIKFNLVNKKYLPLAYLTQQINMFLFIFNMLPIPGFDGFQVFNGLIQTIF